MGSRRFPGKVLAPFRGEPILLHVVRATRAAVPDVVVLTSTDASDDPVAAYVASIEVPCFRGPRDDVFERFRLALAVHPADWIVRICGDSPLLDAEIVRSVVDEIADGIDVVTTVRPRTVAAGQAAEAIRAETLLSVDATELSADDREHVLPFFYRNPDRFTIRNVNFDDPEAAERRLVVDTLEDLERLEREHA
jgi:spore coat polysaccharide biosynthesis protein SpsF